MPVCRTDNKLHPGNVVSADLCYPLLLLTPPPPNSINACAGGDTKLAEELTTTGQKTAQYADKKPETKTTEKKVDSHYVS